MPIERIEVYLNNSAEPVQVLKQPPFKVSYDTRSLSDGEHTLKVVTHYTNGSKEIKEIPFKVANTPGVLVQGLEEGKEVTGNLDVTVRVADADVRPGRERFPGIAAVAATAAILGGVWLFFAATGATNETLREVAAAPAAGEGEAHGGGTEAAAPADAALIRAGETVYTASGCVGCHAPNGAGGVGPALAGDENLANTERVVTVIVKGAGAMPAFAQLSNEDVAAVSTYIRNSWGNKFGGVSAEEVAAARE